SQLGGIGAELHRADFADVHVCDLAAVNTERSKLIQLARIVVVGALLNAVPLRTDASLLHIEELGHDLPIGTSPRDDLDGLGVDRPLQVEPSVLNVLQGRPLATDESRAALVPTHPAVAMRGAS